MVEYINYKGEHLPFRTNMHAIKCAVKETGKNIYEVFENLEKDGQTSMNDLFENLDIFESLLFYSLQAGHNFKDKEFLIKREDATYILDVCFQEFYKGMIKTLYGDQINETSNEANDPPDKKK